MEICLTCGEDLFQVSDKAVETFLLRMLLSRICLHREILSTAPQRHCAELINVDLGHRVHQEIVLVLIATLAQLVFVDPLKDATIEVIRGSDLPRPNRLLTTVHTAARYLDIRGLYI